MGTLEMNRTVTKAVEEVSEILERAGYDEDSIAEKIAEFSDKIEALCMREVEEHMQMEEEMEEMVVEGIKKVGELSLILGNGNGQVEMPPEVMSMPLVEKLNVVESNVAALRETISKREENLMKMHGKIHKLWEELDIVDDENYDVDMDRFESVEGDLSDERLSLFKSEMLRLQEIKKERQSLRAELTDTILDLWDELDLQPSDSFEKAIEKNAVSLSTEAMSSLRLRKDRLEALRAAREEEVQHLIPEITRLWELLHVDQETQAEFYRQHTGLSQDTIMACKMELNSLMVKFHDSLKGLTEDLRAQVRELWEKLHYGAEKKAKFEGFYETEYSEKLLREHQEVVETLQELYVQSKPIMDAIEARITLKEEMRKFDAETRDPARLTSKKSRPGNLLAEERFRTSSKKKLAKMESKLVSALKQWQTDHGEAFEYNGEAYYPVLKQEILNNRAKKPVKRGPPLREQSRIVKKTRKV